MQEKFLKLLNALGVEAKFANPQEPSEAEMNAAFDAATAAAISLKQQAEAQSREASNEKEIRDLIVQSGNALTREGAKQVLADRKVHAKSLKEKAKK